MAITRTRRFRVQGNFRVRAPDAAGAPLERVRARLQEVNDEGIVLSERELELDPAEEIPTGRTFVVTETYTPEV